MVEVTIQNIIGTVALIGLVISACFFYEGYTSFIRQDVQENQLKQISENVALNIEELTNLAKFSLYSTSYMVKIIDLPDAVDSKSYQIQLVDDPQKGCYVHCFLTTQPSISADSTLPYNSGQTQLTVQTSSSVVEITTGVDNTKIATSGTVYGKSQTAIYAYLNWGNDGVLKSINIGLGWVEAQQ